ncbi:MAG: hypothetical protein ABUS79_10210, partial [Pseudomonadota bacterium]
MPHRLLFCLAVGVASLGVSPLAIAKSGAAAGTAACGDGRRGGDAVQIWVVPQLPAAGEPLRALAVAEETQGDAELVISGPDGRKDAKATTTATRTVRRGGAPFSYDAAMGTPEAGRYTIELIRDGKSLACRKIDVAARSGAKGRGKGEAKGRRTTATPVRATGPGIWPATRAWDRATENFYAAWIESLFDAPVADSLNFRPMSQALRDRDRNLLFDYLGLGEDDPKAKTALIAAPDCADLPYFLRAYFSWKLGLPFGLRDCDRGTDARPPRCGDLITNESALEGAPRDALGAMKKFLRLLANKAHSASARTALGDENTDYYPVKLTRDALRPGTVFADPYGHVLMLVKWVDQGATSGGILLAVDGQPDGSIARKRFWEGTFLYANDVAGAGPGFKMFRPLVRGGDGKLAPLTNAALRADRRFAPSSAEQADLNRDAFYARMGKLINPRGLDAASAHRETLDALVEQIQTRVGSVDNGEKYMRENNNPVVPMPVGAKIFETVGPWEDYATPSRDMRLQIAIHVLETLPDRVVAHPELFNLGGRKPDAVRAEVAKLHAARIKEKSIEYQRSDGSPFKLTVADVLARKAGFEIAYNPNDCVEIRWAAPVGSPEASTCK